MMLMSLETQSRLAQGVIGPSDQQGAALTAVGWSQVHDL